MKTLLPTFKDFALIFTIITTAFLLSDKDFILILALIRVAAFTLLFYLYKIIDSRSNHNNYNTLKLSIGTIMKNPEMQRCVSDHLKTKKLVKLQLRSC